MRPQGLTAWVEAQRIHGISPDDVDAAPTWAELAPRIQAAVCDRQVVIYNTDFDCRFLGDLLAPATRIHCCMRAWAHNGGEWSHNGGSYRWHTLLEAAADVDFDWEAESRGDRPHSAVGDARACRAVWQYLHDPQLRAGLEATTRLVTFPATVLQLRVGIETLPSWWAQEDVAARQAQRRHRQLLACLENFIDYWWLGRSGSPHWASRHPDPGNELAVLFTGTTLRGLELLATFATCYRRKAEIPADLKPGGWFHSSAWYQRELQATAAFVGRRQAYPLFPVSEKQRLDVQFALRLAPVEPTQAAGLASRTELQKMGYSPRQIAALTPVAERYNPVAHFWYPVYRVLPPETGL